jgi:hypothetical protein
LLAALPAAPRAWPPHFIEEIVDACMELQESVDPVDGMLSGGAFAKHGSFWTTLKDDQGALAEAKVLSNLGRNRYLPFAGNSASHDGNCKANLVRK